MAITITSGPPQSIFAWNKDWLLSNLKMMNPFKKNPLVIMDPIWYHTYVTNELSLEETKTFLKDNAITSSKRVAQTIGTQGKIDFSKPHPPLLFISGELDRSQPPIIQEKNAQAYTDKNSVTDWVQFEGRTHNIHLQKNWEKVATYCLNWIKKYT